MDQSTRTSERTGSLFDAKPAGDDIRSRSVRGGAATVASQAGRTLLRFVSSAILGRLLVPEDFGLVAMVMAITNIAVMLGELGLSAATIQKESIDDAQVSGLFWINAAFGLLLTGVFSAAAPLISLFYEDPRLTTITIALSTAFLFGGLAVQHRALLARNLRFPLIAIVELSALAASIGIAVTIAFLGAGYWALVAMHVSMPVFRSIGFWIATGWVPSLPSRNTPLRELVGFGAHVTLYGIVNYFARNADNVLIGRVFGSTALGYYSRAYSLMMLPIGQIRTPLISVGMPALSRLQNDDQRYSRYYTILASIVSFCAVPMAVFMGVYAYEVSRIVLGPGWQGAARVFQILSVAAAFQPVVGTVGMVMLSSGHSKRYMRLGLVMGVLVVASFIAGLPWGVTGIAASYALLNVVSAVPQFLYAFRGTPISAARFLKAQAYPYVTAVASGAVAYLSTRWIDDDRFVLRVAIGLGAMLASYFLGFLVSATGRGTLATIRSSLRDLVGRRIPRAQADSETQS